MHRIFRVKAYEMEHGPHFNEEHARKAVMKQALLEKLDIPKEPTNTEDPRIKELQDEVNELKNIIKQASSMVPPPMKDMLPQDMKDAMNRVDQ